jgi:predicted acyl esterase
MEHGHIYSYKRILTFTTDPFEKDTEICGSVVLTLFASTKQTFPDFKETKFLVRPWDQFPDETQSPGIPLKGPLLTQGRLKGCYAFDKDEALTKPYRPYYTHETPKEIEEGKIYKYEIEIMATANLFKKGHRLRLEVANYDSNAFDHGRHFYGLSVGEDTIYFDKDDGAFLMLPITYIEP